MRRVSLIVLVFFISFWCCSQQDVKVKKRDRKKDIELLTTEGTILLRLSDSTPLHRDNFLRLVKSHYLDSMLFHRVIKGFMIQSGDPASIRAQTHQRLGNSGPSYTLPAEINPVLFHKRGALAAAREGDAKNPERRSSGSQFYIVSGRTFTDHAMDSIETVRLQGRKISDERRSYYKNIGGTPQLDGNYTVFGEVISGLDVVDKIVASPTSSGTDTDRPLQDVRLLKATLVKRKRVD